MSTEEERNITPEESPRAVENAPEMPAHTEDVLSEKLSETAEKVTSELDDLLPELTPAEPVIEPASDATAKAPQIEFPAAPAIETPHVAPARASGEAAESTSDDRLMAALAWVSMVLLQLPIVSVIQLLSISTKDRPFQRHHAISSLLFYAAAAIYEIVAVIAYMILGIVTLGIGFACLWVLFFVPHLLALYYALQAYNGKRLELPVLSDFARKQGWL